MLCNHSFYRLNGLRKVGWVSQLSSWLDECLGIAGSSVRDSHWQSEQSHWFSMGVGDLGQHEWQSVATNHICCFITICNWVEIQCTDYK